MSDIARSIQRYIPLGSGVEISLKNGEKVVGSLEEISVTHLTLKRYSSGIPFSCILDMIATWQPCEQQAQSIAAPDQTGSIQRLEKPGNTSSQGTKKASGQKKKEATKSARGSSNQAAKVTPAQQARFVEGAALLQQARQIINRGKDRESAIPLLREAIDKIEKPEQAIRQLVSLYFQINQHEHIIELLEDYKGLMKSEYRNTILTEAYWQTRRYEETIKPLRWCIKNLDTKASPSKKAYMYQQMGICYMQLDQLEEAKTWFERILEINEAHIGATRNIALCLLKQGKFDEATERLQSLSPDAGVTELLEKIENARTLGMTPQEVAKIFSDVKISNEINTFTDFFLERCSYKGVAPEKVREKSFINNDAFGPEELGNRSGGIRRPQERAEYFLSAAKVLFESKEKPDLDRAYRDLCRSFSSWGDDAVINQKSLETACEWYGEALRVYGGDKTRGNDEGARFTLVRFLYASTGKREEIPMEKEDVPEVAMALEYTLSSHQEPERIFHAITYLIARSQYAAEILLPIMYDSPIILERALQFLQQREQQPVAVNDYGAFTKYWKDLQAERIQINRAIFTHFQSIKKVKLTAISLIEDALKLISEIMPKVSFHLDGERLKQLQKILDHAHHLSRATTFETKERFCNEIEALCQMMLKDIEQGPTILSVEQIYPIVAELQQQTGIRRQEIQINFMPQISLHIPDGMNAPTLLGHSIEVPIFLTNKASCGPADTLELIVKPNPALFELHCKEMRFEGLLRGGESEPICVSLLVTEQAIEAEVFSLSVHVQYRAYTGETCTTEPTDFSIQLGAFQPIRNPYIYAEGAVVKQDKMFYGRDTFIDNVIAAIHASETQSKSFVIYGQMRSGKSSILYHLMERLKPDPNFLIANIGSIGEYRLEDMETKVSIFNQILWVILEKVQAAILAKISRGFSPLQIDLPKNVRDFYDHPTPHRYFIQLLETFLQQATQTPGWQQTKIIVCIDEFQYIYSYIVKGRLSENFMQYWKAILQKNLFSAILVGQDVMPKFIDRFSNEFGVMEKFLVTYLSKEHAELLIEEPIFIDGKTRYRENAVDYILRLTAGNPYYIQILCKRLVEYMNNKRKPFITQAEVKNIQEEMVRGVQRLDTQFDNLITSGDVSADAIPPEDAEAVLKNIAKESRDGFCAREDINCQTKCDLNDVLEDLVMRKVLEKRETFVKHTGQNQYQYKIMVDLYREWLLENA
ncbi:hypothetical protein KSF_063680 [Reticulibacter mediterranei]|uniref:ATPase domain-containing protein n=1 Tax=Reticulibacter mediterranei TaxID=2778369 RepID=A0A8J3IPW5_9CHLR|nr:ATP-binding protein [Reticulibacter mediterranei]GHO96320.1 hypothetical protein KSF_063680 [Reticulibacter mediterranei]